MSTNTSLVIASPVTGKTEQELIYIINMSRTTIPMPLSVSRTLLAAVGQGQFVALNLNCTSIGLENPWIEFYDQQAKALNDTISTELKSLMEIPSLTSLDLQWCLLTAPNIQVIAKALAVNTSLNTLKVTLPYPNKNSNCVLLSNFSDALRRNSSLTSLTLDPPIAIHDMSLRYKNYVADAPWIHCDYDFDQEVPNHSDTVARKNFVESLVNNKTLTELSFFWMHNRYERAAMDSLQSNQELRVASTLKTVIVIQDNPKHQNVPFLILNYYRSRPYVDSLIPNRKGIKIDLEINL